MGMDEHGPAYPEPYVCPTCGDGDAHQYTICNHPLCPDGRDQYGERTSLRKLEAEIERGKRTAFMEVFEPTEPPLWFRIIAALALLGVMFYLFTSPAPAMNHGFNPNDTDVKWFESLQRPNMPGSCCGKGDAYPVEAYWQNPDGSWTAKIGDGSAKSYPDGTTRQPIADGTEVPVAPELVNKPDDDLDNPTDVSWIFMTVGDGQVRTVYCLIRHPQGN